MQQGQAVELIRLKVTPENASAFLEGRTEVDKFTSSLKGYVSTEILKMGDDEYLLVIRWDSDGSVREAQKMTTTASVISDWLGRTAQFVSFDTTFSVYQHEAAQ